MQIYLTCDNTMQIRCCQVLDEKKELRIMEYEENLSILKENTDKEKEMKLSQIEENYKGAEVAP